MTTEKYFEEFSSLIATFSNEYNERIIQKILKGERYATEPERFYFTIISKINGSLDVSALLIRDFHTKPHFHPSLFVLLRSILSDIITGEYVKMIPVNEQERTDLINNINNDHLQKTFNSISGIFALLDEWSADRIKEEQKRFMASNQVHFDSSGKLIAKHKHISHMDMIKAMFKKKGKDEDYSVFRDIYSNYDLFSKYEHLGQLSFQLVYRPYLVKNMREQFADVAQTVMIILVALIEYCSIWNDFLLKETEPLELLMKRLLKYDLNHLSEDS